MIDIEIIDVIAFGWLVLLSLGYQFVTAKDTVYERSISGAVQRRRERWMHEMSERENRIVDVQLLASLSRGNNFFASTTLIIVGGLATLMGSGAKVQVLLERLPFVAKSSPVLWELKLFLLMGIFVFAFFKFAWAFRLSHYAAIMIGACPTRTHTKTRPHANKLECDRHAAATAEIVGIAAYHSNTGLRAFYFAMAAMSWFIHPLLFMAATTCVIAVLIRRDFYSRARAAMAMVDHD